MNTKKLIYTSVTGEQKELVLFCSSRAYLNYKIAFQSSLVRDLKKPDEEFGLKVAYALAKPSLVGKVSFDDFCDDIPLSQMLKILDEVINYLTECVEEDENVLNEIKNS